MVDLAVMLVGDESLEFVGGGVDTFLIGSELRGLTTLRSGRR